MVGDNAAHPAPLLQRRHQRAGRRGGGPGDGSGHFYPGGYFLTGSFKSDSCRLQ